MLQIILVHKLCISYINLRNHNDFLKYLEYSLLEVGNNINILIKSENKENENINIRGELNTFNNWNFNIKNKGKNYSFIKKCINDDKINLFKFILGNGSWSYVERFKKHRYIEHCKNFGKDHLLFQKKWNKVSGIYKITYLPYRMFTNYGSSKNIGQRIKHHYYNTHKQKSFLGLFFQNFDKSLFSITLIEKCNIDELVSRENWYLNRFKPLLNIMKFSYQDPRKLNYISVYTKAKISESLKGRLHKAETRKKMSISKLGPNNFYYGKTLHLNTRLAARNARSIKVYVYNLKNKDYLINSPFISIREAAKFLSINPGTIRKKLDRGLAFKGYLFYTNFIN